MLCIVDSYAFQLLSTTVKNYVSWPTWWPARHRTVLERYHETSAATSQNVEVAFQEIARRALKQEHTEDPMSCWPVVWNWNKGTLCRVWQFVETSLNMCRDVSLRLIQIRIAPCVFLEEYSQGLVPVKKVQARRTHLIWMWDFPLIWMRTPVYM